jgi:hypothetical protein
MSPDTLSRRFPSAGNYVPHTYDRYQLYRYLTQTTPSRPGGYTTHDFSPKEPAWQWDDGPQTVEQLVSQGYFAIPAMAPEIATIHDKKQTSWLGLDDVVGQIRGRWQLYEENMLEIEWSKCYAFNELAHGGWPASGEQECVYHKRLQELHAEQRAERIAVWRDISELRQTVPESLQQYLSAFRKSEILDDLQGDEP